MTHTFRVWAPTAHRVAVHIGGQKSDMSARDGGWWDATIGGGGYGVLCVWGNREGAVVCEVRDAGQITDPLVGRQAPGPDVNGLWQVNQLCDLVEIRSGRAGPQVRLTMAP
jgi:1,4-alpha-glucan branching enzyme